MIFCPTPEELRKDYQAIFVHGTTVILENKEDVKKFLKYIQINRLKSPVEILEKDSSEFCDTLNKIEPNSDFNVLETYSESDDPEGFITALQIAAQIWEKQDELSKNQLKLAIALPKAISSKQRIKYVSAKPALALYPGSLKIRFTPRLSRSLKVSKTIVALFGASNPLLKAVYALKGGLWLIAFVLEPTVAPATAIKQLMRDEAAKMKEDAAKKNICWSTLEKAISNSSEINGKKGIIILLHGVFSTDVGTFKGFVDAWNDKLKDYVCKSDEFAILGWPHDTLAGIDENAKELSGLVEKLKVCELPIVFVCHSRGGLVARRTIVYLKQQKYPIEKLAWISFGTPHKGSEFAECGPEEFAAILYMFTALFMIGEKSPIALFQVLRYYWGGGTFAGVENLRPPKSQAKNMILAKKNFINQLEESEEGIEYSKYAVSGDWKLSSANNEGVFKKVLKWLDGLYFDKNNKTNDGIVSVESAKPDGYYGLDSSLPCMHTEYFEKYLIDNSKFTDALKYLADTFFKCKKPTPPPGVCKFYKAKGEEIYHFAQVGHRPEAPIRQPPFVKGDNFHCKKIDGIWQCGEGYDVKQYHEFRDAEPPKWTIQEDQSDSSNPNQQIPDDKAE